MEIFSRLHYLSASGMPSGVPRDAVTIHSNDLEGARKKLKKEKFATIVYLITKGVFFLLKLGALGRAHTKEDLQNLIAETENYFNCTGCTVK